MVRNRSQDTQSPFPHRHKIYFSVVVILVHEHVTCLKRPLKMKTKIVLKTDYRLMQIKNNAELEHSAKRSTFIKLPFVMKIFVLSILKWTLMTGFTV